MRVNLLTLGIISAVAATAGPAPRAQTISITDRDCAQIVNYSTPPDVAYQPGVDVHGRPVAPADLNPQPQIGNQPITIDITADLHKYGVPSTSPLLLPGAHIGQVTIEDSGRRVYFNGQPLGDTEQKAIAEACRQRQMQRR